MDDIREKFTRILNDYPDALSNRRVLLGLLRDLSPGKNLQTNLLLNLYDLDFHGEIGKAAIIDNVLVYRFTKRLCDEYGVSRKNSEWAVLTWCLCYGESLLGLKTEETKNDIGEANSHEEGIIDAKTFDVSTGDYVDDWRDIYEYEVINGGVVIKKYITFEADEVVVPESIEGYPIQEIGEGAFSNCKTIKKIVLPDNLHKIGKYVFNCCESLADINLPNGLTEIGSRAFYCCKALNEINLPDGINEIGDGAFSDCCYIDKIEFPKRLKKIGEESFKNTKIKCIDIPDGTNEIGKQAFSDCKNLEQVRLPNSVVKIGNSISISTAFDAGFDTSYYRATKGYRFLIDKITIYCNPGTFALQYARRNGYKVDKYENYNIN